MSDDHEPGDRFTEYLAGQPMLRAELDRAMAEAVTASTRHDGSSSITLKVSMKPGKAASTPSSPRRGT